MSAKAKATAKKAKDPCAELKRKLKKRDAELKERDAELKEAREQQTATAEILKVISSSPTDTQPVFDAILENAMRLCGAHMAGLRLYDGQGFRRVAYLGMSPEFAKWVAEEADKYPPLDTSSEDGFGRMVVEKQPIQILDRRESANYRNGVPSTVALVELGGVRTYLAVPLLKEGRVIGGIVMLRPEVRAFTQKQIELLSTFANQAVIAIENVRLFKELQTRNAEITESLEQQTATAEILKVISTSPTDTQPVFEAIIDNALRLCDAPTGGLHLYDGEHLRRGANRGLSPEYAKWIAENPTPASSSSMRRRMIAEQQPIHILDKRKDCSYREGDPQSVANVELNGVLTSLSVPTPRAALAM